MIKAVLFDLDGTLADTAPDLGFALNQLRGERGMLPLPLAATRPVTSHGARGLVRVGFGIDPGDAGYDTLRERFLSIYAENLCRETRLFPGIPELLDALEARGLRWGVVTNKQERFTLPLLDLLNVRARAACVIGGDTVARGKPHPDPLLAAGRAMDLAPESCVFVGDDRRDVEAGHAAGMKVAIVAWGYLDADDPQNWNADWLIKNPQELLQIL